MLRSGQSDGQKALAMIHPGSWKEGNLQVIICEIYAGDNSLPEGNVTPLSTKLFVNFHKINQSEFSHSHSQTVTTNNHHGPVYSVYQPTNLSPTEITFDQE